LELDSAHEREPAPSIVIEIVESDGAGHMVEREYIRGEVNGCEFTRQPDETKDDFVNRILASQGESPNLVFLYCD
jgi:hypothetical protein